MSVRGKCGRCSGKEEGLAAASTTIFCAILGPFSLMSVRGPFHHPPKDDDDDVPI